jgi:threonine aldolase
MIDLRSDTVTKPTPEMRRAMAEAEVGDDVYGEDPTVNQLEARAAEVCGKEAALFVPTGTMGNTIAIRLHTEHGQEVICESTSHVINHELAMMAWFAGCLARAVSAPRGLMTWDMIQTFVRRAAITTTATGLVWIENTHNMAGGTVYPLDALDEICSKSQAAGIPVHMDGARVFNAAVACGASVARIARDVDSIMFCLSKGLGAPAGSILAGTRAMIDEARLHRKRLGGGMRQAGVLAAAGLIALEKMPAQLAADHANAQLLAQGLSQIPGITIDAEAVATNIVIFDVSELGMDGASFSNCLKRRGVLANPISATQVRLVTHYDVSEAACQEALAIIAELSSGTSAQTTAAS